METHAPEDTSIPRQLTDRITAVQAELAAVKELLFATYLTPEQYASYIGSVKPKFDVEDNTVGESVQATQPIPLRQPNPRLLKPGKKHQQKYKHHCKVCDGEWIGDDPEPPSCNYCRSTIWRTGETKWALRRRIQGTSDVVVA